MVRSVVCLGMLLLVCAPGAEAQRKHDRGRERVRVVRVEQASAAPVEFGVRGGFDFEDEVGLAGAQLSIPLARQLALVPSGDVFFDDAATQWQLNADVALRPSGFGGLYGGAGAAFVNRGFANPNDRETRVGYNLFAGLAGGRISDTTVRPFLEARWTDVEEYSPFRIVVGINVPVNTAFGR